MFTENKGLYSYFDDQTPIIIYWIVCATNLTNMEYSSSPYHEEIWHQSIFDILWGSQ